MSFGPLSLEPRLVPAPAAPAEGLSTVPGWRLPRSGRSPVGLRPTSVSLAVHALLVLLIVLGVPEWLRRHPTAPPPAIEVALVLPEPPKPKPVEPPPKPAAPTPEPTAPLSSDDSSEAPGRPSPAKRDEAATVAQEPGPSAAPVRKPAPPTPSPVAKPTPAPVARTPAPTPRTTEGPGPAPESTQRAAESETRVATAEPPPTPTPAPDATGATPPVPGAGQAPQIGFGVTIEDPPGGFLAGVYNAYLASMRDKIMTHRELLRTFRASNEQVVVAMFLDDKGRLVQFDVVRHATPTFEYYVKNMVALAPYFGPPPPGLVRKQLLFYLTIPANDAGWDEFMATGKTPSGPG